MENPTSTRPDAQQDPAGALRDVVSATSAWLDLVAPPEHRERVAKLSADLQQFREQIEPMLTEAAILLVHAERTTLNAHDLMKEGGFLCDRTEDDAALTLLSRLTGVTALHEALADLSELADPDNILRGLEDEAGDDA